MLHFLRVALFSCRTFFRVSHSLALLHFAPFSMLHFFRVALFSCCTFFMLHFSHVARFCVVIFSCYTFLCCIISTLYLFHHFLHIAQLSFCIFFRVALFSCIALFHIALLHVRKFSICILLLLYSSHVALFSCCTLFMLHCVQSYSQDLHKHLQWGIFATIINKIVKYHYKLLHLRCSLGSWLCLYCFHVALFPCFTFFCRTLFTLLF